MSGAGNVSALHPHEVTIKRRPDGHYDLMALCPVPGFPCGDVPQVGEVTMVLDDLLLVVQAHFVRGKAANYSMSIASPMVKDDKGMFMWQRLREDPRDSEDPGPPVTGAPG